MKYIGKAGEYFEILHLSEEQDAIQKETLIDKLTQSKESELSLIWFESDDNQLIIDAVEHTFNTNAIVCLTEFHKIEIIDLSKLKKLKLLRFNKPFYCVLNHDSEVGCKGILYFGASNTPILHPNEQELDILSAVWKMLEIEMVSRDNLQLEMLQMMLKRILILCTRIYKNQNNYQKLENTNVDLIREFNFLVEQNFKEKHSVAEYADMLHKSPKTLSNLFKKMGNKSPLQFIQGRLFIEAKRLLKHSEKSVTEIAYELGYNDLQSFSRFFKKLEGLSPVEYRQG